MYLFSEWYPEGVLKARLFILGSRSGQIGGGEDFPGAGCT
jgi:hypothetical protein